MARWAHAFSVSSSRSQGSTFRGGIRSPLIIARRRAASRLPRARTCSTCDSRALGRPVHPAYLVSSSGRRVGWPYLSRQRSRGRQANAAAKIAHARLPVKHAPTPPSDRDRAVPPGPPPTEDDPVAGDQHSGKSSMHQTHHVESLHVQRIRPLLASSCRTFDVPSPWAAGLSGNPNIPTVVSSRRTGPISPQGRRNGPRAVSSPPA